MLDTMSSSSGWRDQHRCRRMPAFLQQTAIVFLWNVIDRFLNMPQIPIKTETIRLCFINITKTASLANLHPGGDAGYTFTCLRNVYRVAQHRGGVLSRICLSPLLPQSPLYAATQLLNAHLCPLDLPTYQGLSSNELLEQLQ